MVILLGNRCTSLLHSHVMQGLSVSSRLLSALCHAITADCLLIEATHTHAVNEQWVWRMANKFMCMFKPAHWGSLGWAFNFPGTVSCRLSSFYLVFLLFWPSITEVCRVLNLTTTNSAKRLCASHSWSPWMPTYFRGLYAVIFGVPVLPGPNIWTNELIKKQ